MQVAGARQPLGVVAVLAPLQGLSGRSLIGVAGGLSALAALAVKGLQRVAKVLIEFCSDFVVPQELPADGASLLLVLIIGGLS